MAQLPRQNWSRSLKPIYLKLRYLTAIGMAILSFAVVSGVLAHADLKSAKPAPGETLAISPAEIELIFSEAMQAGMISLYDQEGNLYPTQIIIAEQVESINAEVTQTLPDGEYSVVWTATSEDGHVISGSYNFAVQAKADSDEPSPLANWPLIALILVGFMVGWWGIRRYVIKSTT